MQEPFDHLTFLKLTPHSPGVYRMFDAKHTLLYIGKAKNLHARLKSYFNKAQDAKTLSLVSQIHEIEYTLTHTEAEALILEHNLIKTHQPRYNILLKDDKSYPYIYISTHQPFPRMEIYRGAKPKQGMVFGPYPSGAAAKLSVLMLQKLFKIRSCSDTFFANRSRPCLQYQIKRCTAPCVGYIDQASYEADLKGAIAFLQGDSAVVIDSLIKKMDEASALLHYEEAALYRDHIQTLQNVSQQQYINRGLGFADVYALAVSGSSMVITQLFIRMGQVLAHVDRVFTLQSWQNKEELLTEFLAQTYLARESQDMPSDIVVSETLPDKALLEETLSAHYKKTIRIQSVVKKNKSQWLLLAKQNADAALARHLADHTHISERLSALSAVLKLPPIARIECFDISHTQGGETVASCVVYGEQGTLNAEYRRFNISGITPGDDYAAIAQALTRHYQKRKQLDAIMPDLIIIDGGKGQLSRAKETLEELQMTDIPVMGVSKGPDRKPGEEQLWLSADAPILLPHDHPALHVIQVIRDEAHRFAIVGHRARRAKKLTHSVLEDIQGVGAKRRQALLKHFGGLQGLKDASIDAIAKTPGISHTLATTIYYSLHPSENS